MEKDTNMEEEKEITEEEYLLECARYNDIEGVKDVLACGLVKLNYQNELKNTALHMSSANNNTEIVEILLESGIDVNLQNESGETALHWACVNGHLNVVKLLVKFKINSKLLNFNQKTAIEEAYERGFLEISDFLIENTDDSVSSSAIFEEKLTDKDLEEEFKNDNLIEKMKELDLDVKNDKEQEKNENDID